MVKEWPRGANCDYENGREYTVEGENTIERFVEEGSWKRKGNVEEISQEEEEDERHLSLPGSGRNDKPGTRFRIQKISSLKYIKKSFLTERFYKPKLSQRVFRGQARIVNDSCFHFFLFSTYLYA